MKICEGRICLAEEIGLNGRKHAIEKVMQLIQGCLMQREKEDEWI